MTVHEAGQQTASGCVESHEELDRRQQRGSIARIRAIAIAATTAAWRSAGGDHNGELAGIQVLRFQEARDNLQIKL